MYQYSRAIYRSIKDMIDPYGDRESQLESRRAVLFACEQTMERLANDPLYFAKPDRALFQDIRRHFPITCQAEVAWAVQQGVQAAAQFIEEQIDRPVLVPFRRHVPRPLRRERHPGRRGRRAWPPLRADRLESGRRKGDDGAIGGVR